MPSEPIHVRYPQDLIEVIRANAERSGVTQADYLRGLVRQDDERRKRWTVPAQEAGDDTLLFRSAHGDDGAMMEMACRLAEKIDEEINTCQRFELFGAAMTLMRLAAECGDGNAQANLAAGLLLRSDAARAMGDHAFADALQIHSIARYDLALDRGASDVSAELEKVISKARPSMVEAARSLVETIAAGPNAEEVQG